MSDKKIESFKIGDTQKAGVSAPKKGGASAQQGEAEAFSLGFTRIEKILEDEDAVAVSDNLNKLLQSLEDFQRDAKTNKDKTAAKKAIIAVERAADLLDYLFQTKSSMQPGA